jgi:hypothetical protein
MDEPVSQAVDLAKGHLDDVPEPVSRFMGTVLGAAEIELSAMLGEQVRAWRFRRQIRIMQRAQQQLEEAGLEARSVPFRTLAPLLDGASFEEDNELTERWASMLAQAAVEPAAVPASFPRVLRELEPVDAQILFLVFDNIMRFAPELRTTIGTVRASIAEDVELSKETLRFHVENLIRLGLLAPAGLVLNSADQAQRVTLTAFGQRFVRACSPAGQDDPPVLITEAPRGMISFRSDGTWVEHEGDEPS